MKKVPNDATVKIVALRHANNMEKIAVKKFTQFPVKLDDVVSYNSYLIPAKILKHLDRFSTVPNLKCSWANEKSRCKKPPKALGS